MTPWTSKLIDNARALALKGHHPAALDCLLTALSVYPDSPDLHRTAAELIYLGMHNGQQEQLTPDLLADRRLDSVFCSCEASECSGSWISAGQFMTETTVTVANPRGGRCSGCGGYFCRKHYAEGVHCPRCDYPLDGAPQVPNGRRPIQTIRLNQPLVHVIVMREGRGRFGPDYLDDLLRAMASDAFEERKTKLATFPARRWPDNGKDLVLASIAEDYPEYLTDGYDIHIQDGRDPKGIRWLMAKVFAKTPKIVDPDASAARLADLTADTTLSQRSRVEAAKALARADSEAGAARLAALVRILGGASKVEAAKALAEVDREAAAARLADLAADITLSGLPRLEAAKALAEVDREAAAARLADLAADTILSGLLRLEAAKALAEVDREAAAARLADLVVLRGGSPVPVGSRRFRIGAPVGDGFRLEAAKALAGVDREAGAARLAALAADTTVVYGSRLEAAKALAGVDREAGATRLAALAADTTLDNDSRLEAARTLRRLNIRSYESEAGPA